MHQNVSKFINAKKMPQASCSKWLTEQKIILALSSIINLK